MALTAEFPVVEWRVAGFTPKQNAHAGVAHLVKEAISTLDLSLEDILRIIVTDSEGYGKAISEFDPKAGFTNDASTGEWPKSSPSLRMVAILAPTSCSITA